MSAKGIAYNAVRAIIADLSDRRGFDDTWGDLEKDIQDEIISTWEKIIEDEINTNELEDSEHE